MIQDMKIDHENELIDFEGEHEHGSLTFQEIRQLFAQISKCQFPGCSEFADELWQNRCRVIVTRCRVHGMNPLTGVQWRKLT